MAMKEISDIISAYEAARQSGQQTALATVVHVDGSAYRRPGARMLVTDQGHLTGAISGGCLEGDALQKALFAMSRGKSMLVTYDTIDEDDAKLGAQLGCNGIIHVLFEPVNPEDPANPMELLKLLATERQQAVLVTLFSIKHKWEPQPGTSLLMKNGLFIPAGKERAEVTEVLRREVEDVLKRKTSVFHNYVSATHDLTAFIEFVPPPVALVVIGAGNDVVPLVKMADVLGWTTTVVDGRPNLARPDRFLPSCQVLVSKPDKVLERVSIDEDTVVLLMTHNYNYDLAMLKALLPRKVAYIGSLGPRAKLERMLEEIRAEGITVTPEQLAHVYGPSGLAIGAETPEEIALSILAEIKAVLTKSDGRPLRNSADVIHPRAETLIEKVHVEEGIYRLRQ
jgi:xanthine/CO dehydrogenase XdhC/CoxF family maturation factor